VQVSQQNLNISFAPETHRDANGALKPPVRTLVPPKQSEHTFTSWKNPLRFIRQGETRSEITTAVDWQIDVARVRNELPAMAPRLKPCTLLLLTSYV
jgi:hypothetical protein